MSNNEAKFILSAYRPGGRDANDPAMTQALAQAKADPALGAWFAREQAHAAAMAAKLREVAPPEGLREGILAGARVSASGGEGVRGGARIGGSDGEKERGEVGAEATERKANTTRRAWWAQPVWLAAAAAIAVLLSVATWWRASPVRGETLEEFAVNFVDKGFRLQKHSADVAVLKTWLSEQRGPLPEALPARFAELRALGCRTLDFRGREVSLVCFERGGKEFHVFVARRDDTPDVGGRDGARGGVGGDGAPQFIEAGKNGLVAAAWADAKNRYVVVSDADMAALRGVL